MRAVNHIAVFARWPASGRVKSRLSPALPPGLACDLHRALLGDTLATALACEAESRTLWWADAPADRAGFEVPPGFEVRDQRGSDLGARLEHACAERLAGAADRLVIVGGDCPDLGPGHLREALARLDTHALVLGPARDGGYTLIGLARSAPGLFRGVAWGGATVLEQTLERARAARLPVALLEPLADLDTPADLVRWMSTECVARSGRAPLTRAALGAMGLLPGG